MTPGPRGWVVLSLIALAAFVGWTIGGFHAQRVAANTWTVNSITHELKSDRQ